MDRPRVTIHNASSIDGRLDGFSPDFGLYYELATQFAHQAVLSGSGTILAAAASQGVEMVGEDPEPAAAEAQASDSDLPWMVIVDSRGRLPRLRWLRSSPHWRDVLILCSAATPQVHIDRLDRTGVQHEVIGDEHVDLRGALNLLADRYDVRDVRVDAGPGLNGALLRDALVDEVSILIAPYIVGHGRGRPLHLFGGLNDGDARRLQLVSVDQLRDDHVWLRFQVQAHS